MAIEFWFGAFFLLGAAVFFIAFPLFFRSQHRNVVQPDDSGRDNQARLRDVYYQRLAELDSDLASGRIDAELHEQLKTELQLSLLEANENTGEHTSTPMQRSGSGLLSAMIGADVTVTLAIFLYDRLGALTMMQQQSDARTTNTAAASDQARANKNSGENSSTLQSASATTDIQAMIQRLKDRLQQQPNDTDGWALLGRSQMSMQDFKGAAESYLKLASYAEQNGENAAPAYGMRAQALYYLSGGRFTHELKEALNQALALDKNEVNSLGLLGVASMTVGEYQSAILYWERTLQAAPDHPERAAIEQGIAEAKRRLAQQADGKPVGATTQQQPQRKASEASPPVSDDASAPLQRSLALTVSLDKRLSKQAPANATVFVYARPANGAKMPVAILRKQVKDLPLNVELDDSMGMMPSLTLSAQKAVTLIARISVSGKAGASTGDIYGEIENISLTPWPKQRFEVRMDKVIR